MLILSPVVWLFNGIFSLSINGLFGYTFLIPLPFKIHTFTLIPITIFYLATFIIIKPHSPVKNFLIALSLTIISIAIYEFVYGIFMIKTHASAKHFLCPTPPHPLHRIPPFGPFEGSIMTLLAGTPLLFFLNRHFDFLTKDRKRIFLFLTCFLGFIVVMLILDHTGFFTQVDLWLKGQTTKDPHNLSWILSKILCAWMFFSLLNFHIKPQNRHTNYSE